MMDLICLSVKYGIRKDFGKSNWMMYGDICGGFLKLIYLLRGRYDFEISQIQKNKLNFNKIFINYF